MNRQKMIIYSARAWKQVTIAILTLDKSKLIEREKENHYVLEKGTTHQEKIITVNIYVK